MGAADDWFNQVGQEVSSDHILGLYECHEVFILGFYLTLCFETDIVMLFSAHFFHPQLLFMFGGQMNYLALATPS